jgi:hypothetical protein
MYGLNHAYLGIMYSPQLILDSNHQTFDLLGRLPEDLDLMKMLVHYHQCHLSLVYFHPTEFENATDSFAIAINLFCKLEDNVKAC